MADSGLASADAGCCVCCVEALATFCFLKSYGAGSSTSAPCGGPRGCCGSCLDNEPDEDDFERAQRKERERRQHKAEQHAQQEKDHENEEVGGIVSNQPVPADAMQARSPSRAESPVLDSSASSAPAAARPKTSAAT